MSLVLSQRSGPRHAFWIAAGIAGLWSAWIACALWTPARDPSERFGDRHAVGSRELPAIQTERDGTAPDDAAGDDLRPGSRAAQRELAARGLAAEMAAQARRQELLARRRLAVRGPAPRNALDLRMKEAFEEDIQHLGKRVVRDLKKQPETR